MDPMPPFTITPVLRAAAEMKIEELDREKESFKRRYHLNPLRSTENNTVKRVSELLEDIKKLDPYLDNNDDLAIMTRFIAQAQDDKSISESRLLKFEEQLWQKLSKNLNRLEVSSLHIELLKEVMEAQQASDSATAKLERATIDDDFEMVENELEEALEEFEQATFTAKDVNVEAIETYLSSLFVGDTDNKHLNSLRRDMRSYGEGLMDLEGGLEQDNLMWVIMELLKSNLISPEKKTVLESYLQSPIALRELVACLNMKSFRHWRYKDGHKGLPITARQNAEGQYCITIEEDVIDLLFLNCTAIGWASKLKQCLREYASRSTCFHPKNLSVDEQNKREYYLSLFCKAPKPKATACGFCHPCYPSAPLPPPPVNIAYNGPIIIDAHARKSRRTQLGNVLLLPSPPSDLDSVDNARYRDYIGLFFMSRLPTQEGCTPRAVCPQEVQARLIKTLAVEARLREAVDGKTHAFAAKFDTSSLPHQTILTVLKFLGVPGTFLDFFTHFLETKLNIGPAVRGAPDRILQRACGVPMGHGLEMLFSEAVLFFLELSVHQKTESYMYRLHDKCYLIGREPQCTESAQETASFASIMGLTFKDMYPGGGKLIIGCLTMDPMSLSTPATASFKIDHATAMVYAHRVKKELDACKTLLDWVRVWNRTAGTYASHLFGPLAAVFGKAHLENVKAIYVLIFSIIFNESNLTAHVKNLLNTHIKYDLNDPPFALEALIYLPQAYGGLGVKNPFVTFNLARNISKEPNWVLENYFKVEEAYYTRASEIYAGCTPEQRQEKIQDMFNDNKDRLHAALGADRDLTAFMSWEELTIHRERQYYPFVPSPSLHTIKIKSVPCLVEVYQNLLDEPNDGLDISDRVCDDIRRLAGTGDMKPWRKLSGEEKWMLQLYGDECFERYGTLEIWWGEGVPIEVYKTVRGHVWSDGDDDDSDDNDTIPSIDD